MRTSNRRCRRNIVYRGLGIVALLAVGCSGEVPKYQVRGQVAYADTGEPVPGGVSIVFESLEPPYSRASGDLDPEGRFDLSTRRQGDGAMEGEHRIRFTAHVSQAQPDADAIVSRYMDRKYCDFETADIKVDIDPHDDNNFTIKVDRGSVKRPPPPMDARPQEDDDPTNR